jgi:spermidine/putrescine transport system substrate-binding protein
MTPSHRSVQDIELLAQLRGAISRRRFVAGGAGVAATLALAACGTKGTAGTTGGATPAASSAPDRSDTEKVVNWSNWPLYLDVDDKTGKHPTLEAFTAETGITVNYTEDVNDPDEFFAKLYPQLSAGQDTGRDVFCVPDFLIARFLRLGTLQELDKANIPNAVNLVEALQDVPFDPGRVYSLPWQSGFTGIAYNPKATGGRKVETIDQLLTDPAIKGKVRLFSDMRETIGLVLMAQGKSAEDFTDDDFDAAVAAVQDAADSGQLAGFGGNDYGKPLSSGDIAACMAYTGDIVQLRADSPHIGYALPPTGHNYWSDNFGIPALAQHKKNAEKLIDYYYRPEVAAEVAAYVNYISPVKGAGDELRKIDPELADNPLIFPSDEVMANGQVFMALTAEQERKYTSAFQAVVGA